MPDVGSVQPLPQGPALTRAPLAPPAAAPAGPGPDCVVMVYSGSNVAPMLDPTHPVVGSFRQLPDLKALAAKTLNSPVAIIAQGYEQGADGTWSTRRYVIQAGQISDRSTDIRGTAYQYTDGQPYQLKGTVPGTGSNVSLMSKESYADFLAAAGREFPGASRRYAVFGLHGAAAPIVGAEAVINGQRHGDVFETMLVADLGDVMADEEKRTGRRLNLVDLNCCQLGKVEDEMQLSPVADYIVASPQNESSEKDHAAASQFQDVTGAITALLDDPTMTAEQFGTALIDKTTATTRYEDKKGVENPVPTLRLYRTAATPQVKAALGSLGERLAAGLDDPSQRQAIFDALGACFHFDTDVPDLKSFIELLKKNPAATAMAPALEKLETAMAATVIHSYNGTLNGTDYTATGPMAAFVPHVPTEADVRSRWASACPHRGSDVGKALSALQVPTDPKAPGDWARSALDALGKLQPDLTANYRAMLAVVPNTAIQAALDKIPASATTALTKITTEAALLGVLLAGSTTKLDPALVAKGIHDDLDPVLPGLADALKGVDFDAYLKDFDAHDGTRLMEDKAKDAFLRDAQQSLDADDKGYQTMSELPAGWKLFTEKLARILAQEVIPQHFKAALAPPAEQKTATPDAPTPSPAGAA